MTIAANSTSTPKISATAAAINEAGRQNRLAAVLCAISALEPNDLTWADAERIGQALKAQTSEAEESAVMALLTICKGRNSSPEYLMKVHACGFDYERAMCVLKPFEPEKREQIIEVAQIRYRDLILKS